MITKGWLPVVPKHKEPSSPSYSPPTWLSNLQSNWRSATVRLAVSGKRKKAKPILLRERISAGSGALDTSQPSETE